jgi:hypothetical protein
MHPIHPGTERAQQPHRRGLLERGRPLFQRSPGESFRDACDHRRLCEHRGSGDAVEQGGGDEQAARVVCQVLVGIADAGRQGRQAPAVVAGFGGQLSDSLEGAQQRLGVGGGEVAQDQAHAERVPFEPAHQLLERGSGAVGGGGRVGGEDLKAPMSSG